MLKYIQSFQRYNQQCSLQTKERKTVKKTGIAEKRQWRKVEKQKMKTQSRKEETKRKQKGINKERTTLEKEKERECKENTQKKNLTLLMQSKRG